jgi:hypothetical protein
MAYTMALLHGERFTLTIWPGMEGNNEINLTNFDRRFLVDHCLIGSYGHAIVDDINDELLKWSRKKMRMVKYVFKGSNNLTEMYSAIRAEVPIESDPNTQTNKILLDHLSKNVKRVIETSIYSFLVLILF